MRHRSEGPDRQRRPEVGQHRRCQRPQPPRRQSMLDRTVPKVHVAQLPGQHVHRERRCDEADRPSAAGAAPGGPRRPTGPAPGRSPASRRASSRCGMVRQRRPGGRVQRDRLHQLPAGSPGPRTRSSCSAATSARSSPPASPSRSAARRDPAASAVGVRRSLRCPARGSRSGRRDRSRSSRGGAPRARCPPWCMRRTSRQICASASSEIASRRTRRNGRSSVAAPRPPPWCARPPRPRRADGACGSRSTAPSAPGPRPGAPGHARTTRGHGSTKERTRTTRRVSCEISCAGAPIRVEDLRHGHRAVDRLRARNGGRDPSRRSWRTHIGATPTLASASHHLGRGKRGDSRCRRRSGDQQPERHARRARSAPAPAVWPGRSIRNSTPSATSALQTTTQGPRANALAPRPP